MQFRWGSNFGVGGGGDVKKFGGILISMSNVVSTGIGIGIGNGIRICIKIL